LGSGVNVPVSSDENVSFTINTDMSIGLAFTKDNYVLDRDQLCTIIKCYESSSFVLKSNLYNIISVSIDDQNRRVDFSPNITAEKKLGKSPFSLQAGLAVNYTYEYGALSFSSFSYDLFKEGSEFNFKGVAEARWYYNLRDRMRKGKTGNGLAANYFGLGAEFDFYETIGDLDIFGANSRYFYINTGVQRFFADHFYFDYAISFGSQLGRYNRLETWKDWKDFQFRTVLGVGYRF
jgi:hypothetical protein